MYQAARRVIAFICHIVLAMPLVTWITTGHAAGLFTNDQYETCLAAASEDPVAALELADTLTEDSRPRAAIHCRALAFVSLDRHDDAAVAFLSLADEIDRTESLGAARTNADTFRLRSARLFAQAGMTDRADRLAEGLLANAGATQATRLAAGLLRIDLAWQVDALGTVGVILDRLDAIAPGNTDVLVRRAAYLRAREKPQAALDLLATPEWTTPPPNLLLERGLANVDTGRLPAARADWLRLIALYPDSAAAAAAERNLDRLDDALEAIDADRPTQP